MGTVASCAPLATVKSCRKRAALTSTVALKKTWRESVTAPQSDPPMSSQVIEPCRASSNRSADARRTPRLDSAHGESDATVPNESWNGQRRRFPAVQTNSALPEGSARSLGRLRRMPIPRLGRQPRIQRGPVSKEISTFIEPPRSGSGPSITAEVVSARMSKARCAWTPSSGACRRRAVGTEGRSATRSARGTVGASGLELGSFELGSFASDTSGLGGDSSFRGSIATATMIASAWDTAAQSGPAISRSDTVPIAFARTKLPEASDRPPDRRIRMLRDEPAGTCTQRSEYVRTRATNSDSEGQLFGGGPHRRGFHPRHGDDGNAEQSFRRAPHSHRRHRLRAAPAALVPPRRRARAFEERQGAGPHHSGLASARPREWDEPSSRRSAATWRG